MKLSNQVLINFRLPKNHKIKSQKKYFSRKDAGFLTNWLTCVCVEFSLPIPLPASNNKLQELCQLLS